MTRQADSSEVHTLVSDLEDELSAGRFSGAQLFVAVNGDVICDVAIGSAVPGRPITTSTVFNLHCALKPVLALAVAEALEQRGLDESVTVSDLLGCDQSALTVRDVCTHTAGLSSPDALSFHLMSIAQREESLAPTALIQSSTAYKAAYSEIAGWHLLRLILERLAGMPADEKIATDLGVLGIDGIWFKAEGPTDPRVDTIGCYVDCASGLPLLHDRTERFWAPSEPQGEGGFASTSALGRWYQLVLRVYEGATVRGLPSSTMVRRWTTTCSPKQRDAALNRECSFSLGFMAGLIDHGFGPDPSPDAFGHSGFLGNSFGLVDPAQRLVVAMFRNGISGDPEVNVTRLRPLAISRIYNDLGLKPGGTP